MKEFSSEQVSRLLTKELVTLKNTPVEMISSEEDSDDDGKKSSSDDYVPDGDVSYFLLFIYFFLL